MNVEEQTRHLDETLADLVAQDKWQSVIELGGQYDLCVRSRYLWAWPSLSGLETLCKTLRILKCSQVLSIGCGCGLLEWLLHRCSAIRVSGLELDQSWWTSPYAPFVANLVTRTFLSRHRVIDANVLVKAAYPDDAKRISGVCSTDFAMLFSYFNDRQSFEAYVRAYTGRTLIIIGPTDREGGVVVTDPRPWDAKLRGWRVCASVPMDEDNANMAVIYERI